MTGDAVVLSVFFLCTALVALATILPLFPHQHWVFRGLDFPRIQVASVALVLGFLQVVLLNFEQATSWLMVSVTFLCLIGQLWWVMPYTPLWRKEVKAARRYRPERALSILTSNVLTPNRNAGELIRLVEQHEPDVLVTLESDQWWEDQLAVLEARMPYSIKCPLDNLYGMHVYSRLPLLETECCYLVEDTVPSMHALLELRSGDQVRMHFVHPAPPSPTENDESSERDAELVIVGRSVADCDEPVIVTGDLNDVAWSPTTRLFRKVSKLLDPRVGRGFYSTFHADWRLMRWPLDHLFHSKHFTLASIARLPTIGSDHFPLLTTVVFTPQYGDDQEPLEPEEGDHVLAREMARSEDVSKFDVPEPK